MARGVTLALTNPIRSAQALTFRLGRSREFNTSSDCRTAAIRVSIKSRDKVSSRSAH
jgi:hypothetical protein